MKICLLLDSFKECLNAEDVCAALARGIKESCPDIELFIQPMADGGEGSAEILSDSGSYAPHYCEIENAVGKPIRSSYQLSADGHKAIVESAKACGLEQLRPHERKPMFTSSYGFGQMIREAISMGTNELILTLGGSATVDGGMGMAQALGFKCLDGQGNEVSRGGQGLLELKTIVPPARCPWQLLDIQVACDVTNPLLGPEGAAAVFAPQKGATADEVALLEAGLTGFADICEAQFKKTVRDLPGSGAAGGLSAALYALLGARLVSGVDLMISELHIAEHVADADLLISGEGKIDSQSRSGKVCSGILRLAAEHNIPCILVGGKIDLSPEELRDWGVHLSYELSLPGESVSESMRHAESRLECLGAEIARSFSPKA